MKRLLTRPLGVAVCLALLLAGSAVNARAAFKQKNVPPFPAMDSVVRQLMQTYDLPAVTVAVVKNEKLVYVNAYGLQDTAAGIPAVNENLFRIASISKPFTVAGILILADQGKLSLDDLVFGEGGILGNDYGPVPAGSGKDKITVRDLIEHKGGWENDPNDPMFSYDDKGQKELIAELLANRPLASVPGEKYYYSNFGYLVLGRVIEKVGGMPYETFMQENVLKPCGIKHMRVGGNTPEERFKNEVNYYKIPQDWNSPRPFNVTRMDAHGGWIASAADLARFIVHIDRNGAVPDIISPLSLSRVYFGNPVWNHTGSLPGTATVLMRLDDEYSFVVLTNYRSFKDNFWNDFINKPAEAIRQRTDWPDIDLFKKLKY